MTGIDEVLKRCRGQGLLAGDTVAEADTIPQAAVDTVIEALDPALERYIGSPEAAEHLRQACAEPVVREVLARFCLPRLAHWGRRGERGGLWKAVTLVSMLDGYPDSRDASMLLTELAKSAALRKTKAAPIGKAVAKVSNTAPDSWVGGSTQDAIKRLVR